MPNMERAFELVVAVLLAVLGGLARLLNAKDKRAMKRGRILSELFVSGFVGLMVLLIARTVGLTGDWLGLVCGMAGWAGPKVLDEIWEHVKKKTGIKPEEEKQGGKTDVD